VKTFESNRPWRYRQDGFSPPTAQPGLTVLSLISFLVCIGASIFWWRGCRGGVDTLIYSKSHENKLLIQSVGGRLECWTLNNEGMIWKARSGLSNDGNFYDAFTTQFAVEHQRSMGNRIHFDLRFPLWWMVVFTSFLPVYSLCGHCPECGTPRE
jgi:hypothetical protein